MTEFEQEECYIIILDDSNGPGAHSVATYVGPHEKAEYFDSYWRTLHQQQNLRVSREGLYLQSCTTAVLFHDGLWTTLSLLYTV